MTFTNLDAIALDCAHKIEDEFAKGHLGGAAQRTARIQLLVREAIKQFVTASPPS